MYSLKFVLLSCCCCCFFIVVRIHCRRNILFYLLASCHTFLLSFFVFFLSFFAPCKCDGVGFCLFGATNNNQMKFTAAVDRLKAHTSTRTHKAADRNLFSLFFFPYLNASLFSAHIYRSNVVEKTNKISPVDCTMCSFWFLFFRLQFWNVSDTVADCLYYQLVARCGHSRRRTTSTSLCVTNFRRDKTTISIDMLRFRHANNVHIHKYHELKKIVCERRKKKKQKRKEEKKPAWMNGTSVREWVCVGGSVEKKEKINKESNKCLVRWLQTIW